MPKRCSLSINWQVLRNDGFFHLGRNKGVKGQAVPEECCLLFRNEASAFSIALRQMYVHLRERNGDAGVVEGLFHMFIHVEKSIPVVLALAERPGSQVNSVIAQ